MENIGNFKKLKTAAKAFLIAAAFAAAALLFASGALALPQTLHESKETSIITRGVTLEKSSRLTVDGWLSYSVLRVDLTDRFLSLDALYDQTSLTTLADVGSRARSSGAIAAVNGAFFSGLGSGGLAIGTMMRNGVVDTADCVTNSNGGVLGSITVNKSNEVLFGFVNPTTTLYGAGGAAVWIDIYNKPNVKNDYAGFAIYDRKHTKYSVGASEKYPDIVELVVQAGAVREVREAMPAVEIPVDGFVVVARASKNGGRLLEDAFKPGSPCRFEVRLAPTLDDAVFHMDGSSILIAAGKIPSSFSYNPPDVARRNPRTMVGMTRDKAQFIIVVVDGRQAHSIGLDTYESAELMLSLGAWEALNFDGGGSSAMVARDPSENALSLVNSPSDGRQRGVINALGVFTGAPKATVGRIEIEAEADSYSAFVGSSRRFVLKAYDRYDNPMAVDPADIVWSTSGIRGRMNGGVLRPARPGVGMVRARVGRVRAEVEVRCLEPPAQIVLDVGRQAQLRDGESRAFKATGRTNAGFSAPIDARDVTWTAYGGVGRFEDGVFTRAGSATGYVTASFGDARAHCEISTPGAGGAGSAGGAAAAELPADTRIADPAGRVAEYKEGPKSFRFAVFGTRASSAMESALAGASGQDSGNASGAAAAAAAKKAEEERKSKVAALMKSAGEAYAGKVNQYIDIGAYVGFGEHPGASSLTKRVIETDYAFEAYDAGEHGGSESRIIKMSTASGGVRAAGKLQWRYLIDELSSFSGKNLFILMQQSPSTFADKLEAPLLRSLLAKYSMERGYQAYVFYAGATDSVWIEDGVRYFSVAGITDRDVRSGSIADTNYLLVTVMGDEVTYAYRKLV